MRLTRIRNDETVDELARRVFRLSARSAKKKIGAAEAALLAANPALRESAGLRGGALLSVPDVPDLEIDEDETWSGDDGPPALADVLRRALDRADASLSAAVESCREEEKRVGRLAKRRQVKTLARADERLGDHLERVVSASAERARRVEERRAEKREALKRLRARIERRLG